MVALKHLERFFVSIQSIFPFLLLGPISSLLLWCQPCLHWPSFCCRQISWWKSSLEVSFEVNLSQPCSPRQPCCRDKSNRKKKIEWHIVILAKASEIQSKKTGISWPNISVPKFRPWTFQMNAERTRFLAYYIKFSNRRILWLWNRVHFGLIHPVLLYLPLQTLCRQRSIDARQ